MSKTESYSGFICDIHLFLKYLISISSFGLSCSETSGCSRRLNVEWISDAGRKGTDINDRIYWDTPALDLKLCVKPVF